MRMSLPYGAATAASDVRYPEAHIPAPRAAAETHSPVRDLHSSAIYQGSGRQYDFEYGIVGHPGPYVVADRYPDRSKEKERFKSSGRVKRGMSRGTELNHLGRNLGEGLMSGSEAFPQAFLQFRNADYFCVHGYLSASNFCKGQTLLGKTRWADAGWCGKEESQYIGLKDELKGMLRDHGDSIHSTIQSLKTEEEQALWMAVYRAAIGKGDLVGWAHQLASTHVPWKDIQSSLVAMRLFSEEQAALLGFTNSLNTVRSSIKDWQESGHIEPYESAVPMPLYRVTELAVREALSDGLLSMAEAPSRLSIRRGQELHDLAVGDALILLHFDALRFGGQIEDIKTEMAYMKEFQGRKAVPDFYARIRLKDRVVEMEVEVVGHGANYRGEAKMARVKKSGFKVFNPGFDGHGCRAVRL